MSLVQMVPIEELIQTDLERLIFERCWESPLMRPWCDLFVFLPSVFKEHGIDEAEPYIIAYPEMGGIANFEHLDKWLKDSTRVYKYQKLTQAVREQREKVYFAKKYQEELDSIPSKYQIQYEGSDVENGYERVDFHLIELPVEGKPQKHLHWFILHRNIAEPTLQFDRDHGSHNWRKVQSIMDYVLRESDAQDWNADKIKAWLEKQPQYWP